MWSTKPSSALILFAVLTLQVLSSFAKEDGPDIKKSRLENPPANLFYFEDTDTILIHDLDARSVLRSDDAGVTWEPVKGIEHNQAYDLWPHPYDKKVAYVLGFGNTHWITKDQGASWTSFTTEQQPSRYRPPFSFHAGDSEKVILHQAACDDIFRSCEESTSYTTDGFKHVKTLREETRGCVFAHSTPLFQTSDDDKDDNRIVCVARGRYSPLPVDNRLVVSDNFFKDEREPYLEDDRTVQGIINVAVVKGFLVAAAKSAKTDELALYVTRDAEQWHRAVFPSDHRLEQDAYTVLESTNYSIQVDVMTTPPINPMGVLFTSNSNGTYFTRNEAHTNRDHRGIVDFEKVQGIQGIVLVNIVDNWEEVEKTRIAAKKVRSTISFDDGRTFQDLKYEGNDLHLHSTTQMSNVGKIFSSPAPGLIMGIGNTGKFLKDYEDGDLYVSDDAGLTWRKGLNEAHKYEFGDQGSVLVAVFDEGPTEELSYSTNHGKDWEKAKLPAKIRAKILTTTPDSTSLKFLLVGTEGRGDNAENIVLAIDFSSLRKRKCKDDDFELWNARKDENGQSSCIMGREQKYRRRKADADCFIYEEFKDPVPQFDSCPCTKEDFECDYNFVRTEDGKYCQPAGRMSVPEDACKNDDETYKGSSGFRLIAGNGCTRKGGDELDEEMPRDCKETAKPPPASGEISHEATSFHASSFKEYYYLERVGSSRGEDETVVMLTDNSDVFITKDHGKVWEQILKDEPITAIYPHQYLNDVVYFLTRGKKVFSSINRGDTISSFQAPDDPTGSRLPVLAFHPSRKTYIIWTGARNCGFGKGECHNVASYSSDGGDHWKTLSRYVNKCEFIKEEGRGQSEDLVYCEVYEDEKIKNPLQLRSSENWFADSEKHFDDIVAFATMSEFIVVAAKEADRDSLKVDASIDGKTFADARFPPKFDVPSKQAFTVLDSSTHAVFMHVTVHDVPGSEYGTIVKSNSNGTSYVLSLNGVNRNADGYVDFEKMLVLEGVALVNVVDNIEDTEKGSLKKLKSMITHNDGAQWALIKAPQKDPEDRDYECDVANIGKCSLHLHGYTERKDPRDTFSSFSAVGMMMAVGNVGEYLTAKDDGDTFFTRDGGVEWTAVKKGNYMWEFGDQGSIIVIVEENVATKFIFYSIDEGQTWQQYQFTDSMMQISSISTVPSDNSRNFLLWGRDSDKSNGIKTVNIDFTGLWDRPCTLHEENPEGDDFYLWTPIHPAQKDDCLFGHVAQYYRKKPEADCYNGYQLRQIHNISRNCDCTRGDFEW